MSWADAFAFAIPCATLVALLYDLDCRSPW